MKYCESIYKTKRWKTREVMVGNVGVGGDNPVRIQSMTTSNTRDVDATIDQAIRLTDAGCEIVRMTVQGMKEAEACEHIKNGLVKRGYNTPLVADIHFYPPAAMAVADFVDKVRINPGNFVDKRAQFKVIEYDDQSYAEEIEKIEEKFTPLVEKCKRLKRSMRIGTNHGSLSDRIMNRYGDTPRGMVESAIEFAEVCRKNDYHQFIFSMKASNPVVMIQAYRMLVAEMMKRGWDYPLHLGVTEAGMGEDGRIKSAMGIGSLLLDGLGDTIRVSLTEDPWYEIDPCNRLIKIAESYINKGVEPFVETFRDVENVVKRPLILPRGVGLHRDGSVFSTLKEKDFEDSNLFKKLGCDVQFGVPKVKVASSDSIVLRDDINNNKTASTQLNNLFQAGVGIISTSNTEQSVPLLTISQAVIKEKKDRFAVHKDESPYAVIVKDELEDDWKILETLKPAVMFLGPTKNRLHASRRFFEWIQKKGINVPVILNFVYDCSPDDLIMEASAEAGSLFCDGLGDGIWLEGPYDIDLLRNISFGILQASRKRTFKTDFISCPSCGRTLFDLQDVTKRIKARTDHLPGVKIAIMGCIVNGPGEMADADFGYVGSAPGKIDLYIGKERVEKNIDFAAADDRLIDLIKAQGRWIEPPQAV